MPVPLSPEVRSAPYHAGGERVAHDAGAEAHRHELRRPQQYIGGPLHNSVVPNLPMACHQLSPSNKVHHIHVQLAAPRGGNSGPTRVQILQELHVVE